jgi:hypothetical protein
MFIPSYLQICLKTLNEKKIWFEMYSITRFIYYYYNFSTNYHKFHKNIPLGYLILIFIFVLSSWWLLVGLGWLLNISFFNCRCRFIFTQNFGHAIWLFRFLFLGIFLILYFFCIFWKRKKTWLNKYCCEKRIKNNNNWKWPEYKICVFSGQIINHFRTSYFKLLPCFCVE